MVLAYYQVRIDPVRLWRILGVTDIGAPPTRLPDLAKLGLSVKYEHAHDEAPIVEALRSGMPPICLVATGALPYWTANVQHAVVVAWQDERGFHLNDPAFADRRHSVSYDAFMLAWSEMDYQYAVVAPR